MSFVLRRTLQVLLLMFFLEGEVDLAGASIDLSQEPDPRSVVQAFEEGNLSGFHRELGNSLALTWRPFKGWHSGMCDMECYGLWVDLYKWIDLLESDEASVTKRWLSRHLSVDEQKFSRGGILHATIHQPGAPLVRRYDRLQHLVTEQLAGNAGMLHQALSALIMQPFEPKNGILLARLDHRFVRSTLAEKGFWSSWSACYEEDDFAPRVLLNLQSIWEVSPSDFQEFRNLALAVALVHDQPVPDFWPHRQVPSACVLKVSQKPAEIFKGFVSAFREGKLKQDPRHLGVRELTFLIDAPVVSSEYEFIRSSPSLSRENPSSAFDAISYDQGRVERDAYVWPWGGYSLSSIRNHGGICVDQAYYAAVSGKALGIPTMFFSGEGRDGGHAWVGYLRGHGHWDLNVGRHGEKSMATGITLNPQNWAPITDHEIAQMTSLRDNNAMREAALRDLNMASVFRRRNNASAEGEAIRSALTRCPGETLFWDACEDWLQRTGSSAKDIQRHHEAAIRQFSHSRDLKAQHEEALVRLAGQRGDKKTQQKLSERIIHENLGVRNDLSATAAGQMISFEMESNDPESALKSYEEQLGRQAVVGRGDFFYRVTVPLAMEFIAKGRLDLARRVLKRAYETINPARGSLVDKEFRKLWLKAGGKH